MCKFQCLVLTDTVEGDDKVSWPLGCTTVWETYLNTTVCRNLELGDKCVCVVLVCVCTLFMPHLVSITVVPVFFTLAGLMGMSIISGKLYR